MRPCDFHTLEKRAQTLATSSGLIVPKGEKLVIAAMDLGVDAAGTPVMYQLALPAVVAAVTRHQSARQRIHAVVQLGTAQPVRSADLH
jgi:hypothetical protein